MENLTDSINYIVNDYKNSIIWFGGDLNLPNINWANNTISGTSYSLAQCNVFLDLLTSYDFTQMNLQPTSIRYFLTNHPTLISDIVIPGISDHEAVCTLTVKFVSSIKGTVFLEQGRLYINQSLGELCMRENHYIVLPVNIPMV